MTVKELVISKINTWIQEEVVTNKLSYIINYPESLEIDFEKLTLVDLNIDKVFTSDKCDIFNEYVIINHIFEIGNGEQIELVVAEYNNFSGIFVLENYDIWHSNSGTELIEDRRMTEHYGLESILNECEYAHWFNEVIEFEYLIKLKNELALERMIPLEKAQELFNQLVKLETAGFEATKFTFASGASLLVPNEKINEAVYEMERLSPIKTT